MPRANYAGRRAYSTRIPYGQSRNVSEAYAYDDWYEMPKPTLKRTVKRKVRKKLVFVSRPDAAPRVSFKVFFTILLVFAGCVAYVYTSAMTHAAAKGITLLNQDVKKQKDINAALTAELTQNFDLAEIERIAVEKLGMHKPGEHQIVYYNNPKQSYVVQNYKRADGTESEPGLVEKALNWLGIGD